MIIFIDGTLVTFRQNGAESCNLNAFVYSEIEPMLIFCGYCPETNLWAEDSPPSAHPINLESFHPISMLVVLATQPADAITLLRLIVSRNYWCRSCGGGAKMEAANWIVTVALLCHTVLALQWMPSRPLITRMNGINLTIQWGGNGTFKHSCLRVCNGLRGVKSRPMRVMRLTRQSVRSYTIFWTMKLEPPLIYTLYSPPKKC